MLSANKIIFLLQPSNILPTLWPLSSLNSSSPYPLMPMRPSLVSAITSDHNVPPNPRHTPALGLLSFQLALTPLLLEPFNPRRTFYLLVLTPFLYPSSSWCPYSFLIQLKFCGQSLQSFCSFHPQFPCPTVASSHSLGKITTLVKSNSLPGLHLHPCSWT